MVGLYFLAIYFWSFIVINNGYIINFDDPWEYRITPSSEPILRQGGSNHELPLARRSQEEHIQRVKNAIAAVDKHKKVGDSVRQKLTCANCRLGTLLLQREVRSGSSFEDIKRKFVSLCVGLNIENNIVCTGLFDVFGPTFLPALNLTEINIEQICSLTIGELCGAVENPLHEWEVELPKAPKPKLIELELPSRENPTFKVLQLTDVHYDPNYVQGTPANCDEPMCCHTYSTVEDPLQVIEPAGKWGSYLKCDMPKIFIEHMLKDIVKQHPDIDYIIWSGDLPPHDIWNQTRKSNLQIIEESVRMMLDAFPTTPIFPAVGNHESAPAGSFPPPWMKEEDRSINWLYQALSEHWQKWLPISVNNTLIRGAFYSVLLRPGFRLISINTNYCMALSWYLVVNSTDPASELKWLIHELQAAEDNNEKVHIIGHAAPGDSGCLKIWSRNFYKIIERYEATVMAQFYGHSHFDEYEVFYDTTNFKKTTNIAYISPSVTTFENQNPGYRIYYIDGDHSGTTREVIDHETWIVDLELANVHDTEPVWRKLYSAKSAYGLSSLRPKEWSDLIDRLLDDSNLFNLYYNHYYKASPVKPPCNDNQCKLLLLCDLRSGRSHDRHHLCKDLENKLRV